MRLSHSFIIAMFHLEQRLYRDQRRRRSERVSVPFFERTNGANGQNGSGQGHDRVAAGSLRKSPPRWKKVIDLGLVLLLAPIWLPLMILVMAWIKATSPGPVFFRQRRVGYGGAEFLIFKFRTMKVNAETQCHESYFEHLMKANCPMVKLDASGDPRLISCGGLLRASGLDELPQVFNIIAGEMSLVGPRPCTPHEFARYTVHQRKRVHALPGLTGYWQVNGKNKTTFPKMIAMDICYIRHISPWLDLAIILKTIPVLIAQLIEARQIRRPPNPISVTATAPVTTTNNQRL
jgi:lipopolysaccharide/colanic/teichoic acid biosynthesis glycosyltransferase